MKRLFSECLEAAQQGEEQAVAELIRMYQPLIIKLSTMDGEFNEDLYQEQLLCFSLCIKKFSRYFNETDKLIK